MAQWSPDGDACIVAIRMELDLQVGPLSNHDKLTGTEGPGFRLKVTWYSHCSTLKRFTVSSCVLPLPVSNLNFKFNSDDRHCSLGSWSTHISREGRCPLRRSSLNDDRPQRPSERTRVRFMVLNMNGNSARRRQRGELPTPEWYSSERSIAWPKTWRVRTCGRRALLETSPMLLDEPVRALRIHHTKASNTTEPVVGPRARPGCRAPH